MTAKRGACDIFPPFAFAGPRWPEVRTAWRAWAGSPRAGTRPGFPQIRIRGSPGGAIPGGHSAPEHLVSPEQR